ncbi:MAG: hypothetical protein DWH74_00295 [Planctomycetota bacterium]|nr:MAG: hypothetical protein DWH74_00295 [Planctomycetota bacterium]
MAQTIEVVFQFLFLKAPQLDSICCQQQPLLFHLKDRSVMNGFEQLSIGRTIRRVINWTMPALYLQNQTDCGILIGSQTDHGQSQFD